MSSPSDLVYESARLMRLNTLSMEARSRAIRERAQRARDQAAAELIASCRPLGCADIDRSVVAAQTLRAYGYRRAW